jgi:dihydroceramidase
MQLLDELSMIYTTCIMFYAIFSHGKSTGSSILFLIFTIALAIFITTYYHYLQNPVFHQNTFALLTVIVLLRSMYAMEIKLRPSLNPKRCSDSNPLSADNSKEKLRRETRDVAILRTMWKMIACGVSAVAGGFLIWTLDNEFCSTLRSWRREIGLPWGILLEGHGWW